MPYKILTYTDPYSLHKADYWDAVKSYPHFCVSRTLANGLVDIMQDSIEGLICQLDDFVDHEGVYRDWTANISLRIKQYSYLTSVFKALLNRGDIDDSFFHALQQNQNHFLDALRLFIELDISSSSLHSEMANREQRLFINILSIIESEKSPLFLFPKTPNLSQIKQVIDNLAEKELIDFDDINKKRKSARVTAQRAWLERSIINTKSSKLQTIVVHGVHQFSPARLRLLIDLERAGLEVIFLFNYQRRFPEVYSSWDYIYRYFDVPMHHDSSVKEYKLDCLPNRSHALGKAIGELCEGRFEKGDESFRSQYEKYKECELREFGNVTEYATFISHHFDKALKEFKDEQSVMDRANNVFNTSAVLRLLNEQVYTANRDVHGLLKIYYPQFSKDRHFLSYPIGQFFSALYRLWNWETGEIDFNLPAIKECLSSGILRSGTAERLLRTAYQIGIILEDVSSFSEFCNKVKSIYLSLYNDVLSSKPEDRIFSLKQMSIYSKYKINKADIENLFSAISEINLVAVSLFATETQTEDRIDFGIHFANLEEFIKKSQHELASEEERTLISALLERFDQIKDAAMSFSGTFNDLRNGIHYYLKQKNDETQVDWIVKNFEQIDGDILQSKGQFEHGENRVYHFACLSDRDMSCPINDLLPWPLTDMFIRKAYSPIDLQFQVYYAAIGERSSFLRYALFYGLYYNRCDVRLSYVKQYGDETTEPYVLLKILGLQSNAVPENTVQEQSDISVIMKPNEISGVTYDRFQMMSMYLCPHRYFLEYVMNGSPVVEGVFLFQKLYENVLIGNTWKRIQGNQKHIVRVHLNAAIKEESNYLKKYFWFWKSTEIDDLCRRAANYIVHRIINFDSATVVRAYEASHATMRINYGKAQYKIDISEYEPTNPYADFEEFCSHDYPYKFYHLHSLPKQNTDKKANSLLLSTRSYLQSNTEKDKAAIVSDWCIYCPSMGVCLEPFLRGL